MIEGIQQVYEEHGIEYIREKGRMQPMSTRLAHRIAVRRRASIVKLLKLVVPHLRVKDTEANTMLRFNAAYPREAGATKSPPEAREAYVQEMKRLKKVS